MHIGGPFLDKQRRDSRKPWYLSYFIPRLDEEGRAVMVEGRPVLKRERPYYASRQAAIEDKPRIVGQYAGGGAVMGGLLSRGEVEDVAQAKAIAPGVKLADLATFWRRHHPLQTGRTVAEWVKDFLLDAEARLGKTRHTEDLSSRLKRFVQIHGERTPDLISREEIMAYLRGIGSKGRTVLNHKRAVCNFFGWLLAERQVITVNPAGGIKKRQLPKVDRGEIRFLSLVDVARYLRTLERYDPDLVAHEVVQLFAGVRADDEMADFRGEWILPSTREVVIPAAVAKTGQREVIGELEDNFWAWWESYGRQELLRPANYEQRWRRCRALASIEDRRLADVEARRPIKHFLRDARADDWPWNARRRTFCTYHVAKHQSADKTALILRHRGDTYTLHNSYRGTGVTPAQGEAYFALSPAPVERPIRPGRAAKGIVKTQSASDQGITQKP